MIDVELAKLSRLLDISPSDYQRARDRFEALAQWLLEGHYQTGHQPRVYLQGSFRLGTVIRPYHRDTDGDFDIDQVCEITQPYPASAPGTLKQDVGDRLKEHARYEKLLDEEGQRCWTIIYAHDEGRPGFHIDVLPAHRSSEGEAGQIRITHREPRHYRWTHSNPDGYYYWFKRRNQLSERLVRQQRLQIQYSNKSLYSRVEDVPLQLVRSPLQRAIQIVKRHRDVYFAEENTKPISIIITTLITHRYQGGTIEESIKRFTHYVKSRHETILRTGEAPTDGMLDYIEGIWIVPNPVHGGRPLAGRENFADKWNKTPSLATQLFQWVYQLDRDFMRFTRSRHTEDLVLRLRTADEQPSFSRLALDEASSCFIEARTLRTRYWTLSTWPSKGEWRG